MTAAVRANRLNAVAVSFATGVALLATLATPGAAANEAAVAGTTAAPTGSSVASDARPEISRELPDATRVGGIKFTFWGFEVYRASLWASSSFKANSYAAHPFALELAYLRSLDGPAIAKRSMEEMQRQAPLKANQSEAWLAAMARIFPNVKSGDRIVGVNRPGVGATFWVNGAHAGEIVDAEFARLFFGVWLSNATSEPAMRKALLEKAQP